MSSLQVENLYDLRKKKPASDKKQDKKKFRPIPTFKETEFGMEIIREEQESLEVSKKLEKESLSMTSKLNQVLELSILNFDLESEEDSASINLSAMSKFSSGNPN